MTYAITRGEARHQQQMNRLSLYRWEVKASLWERIWRVFK